MSDFHTMVHWFQAAAALVAAVLWSKSAAIKVPNNNIDAVPGLGWEPAKKFSRPRSLANFFSTQEQAGGSRLSP